MRVITHGVRQFRWIDRLDDDSCHELPHGSRLPCPSGPGQAEIPEVGSAEPSAGATIPLLHDGDLVVVEGAGHMPNLEAPEAFNDALDRFLSTPGLQAR